MMTMLQMEAKGDSKKEKENFSSVTTQVKKSETHREIILIEEQTGKHERVQRRTDLVPATDNDRGVPAWLDREKLPQDR